MFWVENNIILALKNKIYSKLFKEIAEKEKKKKHLSMIITSMCLQRFCF